MSQNPLVSVIIIGYEMPQQLPRTVHSFLPEYQIGIEEGDIEIIVIENGSTEKVDLEILESWPASVRYFEVESAPKSPAWALNAGVKVSNGDFICPVIDGARIATPGLLRQALTLSKIDPNLFVTCPGYHIGFSPQQDNPKHSQITDEGLLRKISWPDEPYRLFEISSLGLSARAGLFGLTSEANAPILSRGLWDELGGYDERFEIAGGGFVNLDFFARAISKPDVAYYQLINEGTFHQFHGGATTTFETGGQAARDEKMRNYLSDYHAITSHKYIKPTRRPKSFGVVDSYVRRSLARSVEFYDA